MTSGRPVAFCDSAPCRCEAKTEASMRLLAQLKVRIKRSSVDGAIVKESVEVAGDFIPRFMENDDKGRMGMAEAGEP